MPPVGPPTSPRPLVDDEDEGDVGRHRRASDSASGPPPSRIGRCPSAVSRSPPPRRGPPDRRPRCPPASMTSSSVNDGVAVNADLRESSRRCWSSDERPMPVDASACAPLTAAAAEQGGPSFGTLIFVCRLAFAVVGERAIVAGLERSERERDAGMNVDAARQPHPGNGCPMVIDARISSIRTSQRRRQEVQPDVVEGVLDDLVLGGVDPQRDERRLVHLAIDVLLGLLFLLVFVLLRRLLLHLARRLLVVVIVEEIGRVVLDAQDVLCPRASRGRPGSSCPART